MGFFESIGSGISNLAQGIANGAKGIVDDVKSWCSNLVADAGAGISSMANGDVVGINANKVPEMITSIDDYIARVNTKLETLKEKASASTVNAMQGEYATAVKEYVNASAQVCYNIITQLRYFQDKLVAVKEAYDAKDQSMASAIRDANSDMSSKWTEYQRQK